MCALCLLFGLLWHEGERGCVEKSDFLYGYSKPMSSNVDLFRRQKIVDHDNGSCWDCKMDAKSLTELRYKCLESKCENWRHMRCGPLEFCDSCIFYKRHREEHNAHHQKAILTSFFQQWDPIDILAHLYRKSEQIFVPPEGASRGPTVEETAALQTKHDRLEQMVHSQPLLAYVYSYYKYKPPPMEIKIANETLPSAPRICTECHKFEQPAERRCTRCRQYVDVKLAANQCPNCLRRFDRAANLNRHLRSHVCFGASEPAKATLAMDIHD